MTAHKSGKIVGEKLETTNGVAIIDKFPGKQGPELFKKFAAGQVFFLRDMVLSYFRLLTPALWSAATKEELPW